MRPLQRRIESRMVALLKEHVDAFTWSCQDMPGSDTGVIVHKLPWKGDCPPKKSQTEEGHLADLTKLSKPVEIIQTKAARRLRQYMLVHTTLWISEMDPIEYGFENPALTGRVARRAKEC
ncbi:hypothetical protein KIW84_022893 [Lathyrus oleraceus]|uniref:Uncharacterized protein n=1 Tax=Pisum sativum TaxID=3888 RepID=A0A9D4YHF0_PEA|nr:hypothetical protein KIW84_022893 [Pisum sativum]